MIVMTQTPRDCGNHPGPRPSLSDLHGQAQCSDSFPWPVSKYKSLPLVLDMTSKEEKKDHEKGGGSS